MQGQSFLYSSVIVPSGSGDFPGAMLVIILVSLERERGCFSVPAISKEILVNRFENTHYWFSRTDGEATLLV